MVILVAVVGVVSISESSNGPSTPANIAFVDNQKVLESTKDWQNLNANYEEDVQFYQMQLDNLSKEYETLVNSGATSDEIAAKQQEILSKKSQYEQTLENNYNNKLAVILETINKRIKDYAEFNGIDMVINKDVLLYGNGTYDITDMIISYLKGFENN
jgi:outer membrane protein